jgi:hypothetical protein
VASTVVDPRTTAPSVRDRRRPPATVLGAAAVAGVEAVALLAGGLTGLDDLLLSPLRPSGAVVAGVLLLLACWVVLCGGSGALLLDGSGRRTYTGVAAAELALVGTLLVLSQVTPLLDPSPTTLPLPALALLALGVPVGKLLLAGAPSAVAWVVEGPRAPARRAEPGAAHPRLRAATLVVIAAALVAVAVTTPSPGTATDVPATAGTSAP